MSDPERLEQRHIFECAVPTTAFYMTVAGAHCDDQKHRKSLYYLKNAEKTKVKNDDGYHTRTSRTKVVSQNWPLERGRFVLISKPKTRWKDCRTGCSSILDGALVGRKDGGELIP